MRDLITTATLTCTCILTRRHKWFLMDWQDVMLRMIKLEDTQAHETDDSSGRC